jgi:DNA-binding MarR family transcriptional regulator
VPSRISTARRSSAALLAVALRDAITRVNRRMRQTRPIGDLTLTQISALQTLDGAGAMTPRELADAERVQPPTVTRIVARLEEKGLVARTPHPTDGRQVILAPSPAGRKLIENYRRVRDEWLAYRLAELTPDDRDTLRRAAEILTRIARNGHADSATKSHSDHR